MCQVLCQFTPETLKNNHFDVKSIINEFMGYTYLFCNEYVTKYINVTKYIKKQYQSLKELKIHQISIFLVPIPL